MWVYVDDGHWVEKHVNLIGLPRRGAYQWHFAIPAAVVETWLRIRIGPFQVRGCKFLQLNGLPMLVGLVGGRAIVRGSRSGLRRLCLRQL